jgi:chemotaxis protein methyltransferase CheR
MTNAPQIVQPVVLGSQRQVSDEELRRFAELIYERTGVRVSPQKKTLLSNRLRRRLRQTGIADFAAYFEHVRRLRPSDPEWDKFLQEITTHETYLFRDESQWDWFRKVYLAERAAEGRAGDASRTLRIWSAACSTGDETITAACCAAACLPDLQRWRVEIVGTDIGVDAVAQAKAATFGERAMRLVPEEYKKRFFAKVDGAPQWKAKSILTSMTRYRLHNLLEPLNEKPFDLAILKNVLIYFDAASKCRAIANVRAAIRPGGLLVVGAAEGASDYLKDAARVAPWLYRMSAPGAPKT